eukprot:gene8413-6075_t
MSMAHRMRRADPYSTPARRRRIIADLAKNLLRSWYIRGCDNVHQYRIDTAAAIRIQCFVRRAMARHQLTVLRTRWRMEAAIKLQSNYRMHRAIALKKHLRSMRLLKQQRRLAQVVEHLWAIRQAKLYRAALVVSRQLALERKRNAAAKCIQRVYRCSVGRRIHKHRRYHRQLQQWRRQYAAIIIQSLVRQRLARWKYQRLRKWHRAAHRITTSVVRVAHRQRGQRRHRRRQQAALTVQCWYRGVIARRVRRRLQDEQRLRLPRLERHHQSLEIQVELSAKALWLFTTRPVDVFFRWCVQQCLVEYSPEEGFRSGSVLRQVVASVAQVQQQQQQQQPPTRRSLDEGPHVDIQVDAWDYSSSSSGKGSSSSSAVSEIPPPPVPSEWEQPLHATVGGDEIRCTKTTTTAATAATAATTTTPSLLDLLVQLHLVSRTTTHQHDIRPPVIHETTHETTIRFVPVDGAAAATTAASTAAAFLAPTVDTDSDADPANAALVLEDAVFRFQNAVVYVPAAPPKPIAAVPGDATSAEAVSTAEETAPIVFQDSDSDADDEDNDRNKPPVVSPPREPPARTEIRIHLSVPSPPRPPPLPAAPPSPPKPPPINYGHFARRIQRSYRRRWRLRQAAARVVQRLQRRYRRLERWRTVVYDYWELCFDACNVIQCAFRMYAARQVLAQRRYARDELYFAFGHDFATGRMRDNWRAFGLVLPDADEGEDEGEGAASWRPSHALVALKQLPLPRPLPLAVKRGDGNDDRRPRDAPDVLHPQVSMTTLAAPPTATASASASAGAAVPRSVCDVNVSHPPVWQLVHTLAVPDVPPHCLFPSSWTDTFVQPPQPSQPPQPPQLQRQQATKSGDGGGDVVDDALYAAMVATQFLNGPAPPPRAMPPPPAAAAASTIDTAAAAVVALHGDRDEAPGGPRSGSDDAGGGGRSRRRTVHADAVATPPRLALAVRLLGHTESRRAIGPRP